MKANPSHNKWTGCCYCLASWYSCVKQRFTTCTRQQQDKEIALRFDRCTRDEYRAEQTEDIQAQITWLTVARM